MKKYLIILFLLISPLAGATSYHFATAGNDDTGDGSIAAPYQTITKLNALWAAGTLNAGDSVVFKAGDTFYGTITVKESGTSGNPIIIGSYGSGDNPIISGFTTLSSWTDEGGGIYSKTVTCESPPNMVTIDGVNTPMGRFPDSGWLTIDSYVTNTSITDAALPSSPDWDGAEVVIRKTHWIIDRNTITNHTGTSITYISSSSYNANTGYGYFIQNHLSTLNSFGEWFYDGSKLFMYFGNVDPATKTVKASSLDQLVYMNYKHYITFDNIAFTGANVSGIYIGRCQYLTIQNCEFGFMGNRAIDGKDDWGEGGSPYCSVLNNYIHDCNNTGIHLCREFTNALISNNKIENISTIPGMVDGGDDDGNAVGIYTYRADNSTIEYNILKNIGYSGIRFSGDELIIKNNSIDTYCVIKDDGGGIYCFKQTYGSTEITGNIVLNGVGAGLGTVDDKYNAHGIYIDDLSSNILIEGNSIFNISYGGIMIHNSHEITISNNTIYDCDFSNIYFRHDNHGPDDPIRNIIMNNNKFISKESSQYCLLFRTILNDIMSFGTSDNNYYARPIDDDDVFSTDQPSTGTKYRTLAGWQSFTGQDLNSHKSPISITDTTDIYFYYNASQVDDSVFTLPYASIDLAGTKYATEYTLDAYQGVVLLKDPDPDARPVTSGGKLIINSGKIVTVQ